MRGSHTKIYQVSGNKKSGASYRVSGPTISSTSQLLNVVTSPFNRRGAILIQRPGEVNPPYLESLLGRCCGCGSWPRGWLGTGGLFSLHLHRSGVKEVLHLPGVIKHTIFWSIFDFQGCWVEQKKKLHPSLGRRFTAWLLSTAANLPPSLLMLTESFLAARGIAWLRMLKTRVIESERYPQ